MDLFGTYKNTFKHGIHPPENKDETKGLPIRQFPFAPVLIIPTTQHIGAPAQIIVREGQEVYRGQVIANAASYVSVPIHSPVSGTVRKIGYGAHYLWDQSHGRKHRSFPLFRTKCV
jgi:Na+-translocating ferredoxin:NAD+ oxidoreductase subunit C